MGVVQVSVASMPAISGPTDTQGNTGQLDIGPISLTIRSLTVFNNAANNQFLIVDLPNSNLIKIPASTSFDITAWDLFDSDLRKFTILGKTGDLVTVVYVTGPGPLVQYFGGKRR